MANLVQIEKLQDGQHITLHVFLQSDGSSGDLSNYVIFDPHTDAVPAMPRKQDLIIKQIWYEMGGFSTVLLFEGLTPKPVWVLTPGASLHHDWRFFGGLRDTSSAPLGLDSTGKLLISTCGFTDTDDAGSFVLWMEKRDRLNPQGD